MLFLRLFASYSRSPRNHIVAALKLGFKSNRLTVFGHSSMIDMKMLTQVVRCLGGKTAAVSVHCANNWMHDWTVKESQARSRQTQDLGSQNSRMIGWLVSSKIGSGQYGTRPNQGRIRAER